jgi:hypothetical protein
VVPVALALVAADVEDLGPVEDAEGAEDAASETVHAPVKTARRRAGRGTMSPSTKPWTPF